MTFPDYGSSEEKGSDAQKQEPSVYSNKLGIVDVTEKERNNDEQKDKRRAMDQLKKPMSILEELR